MKLIVGLGNPGPKYETTRHNAGFLLIDRLVDRWKAQGPTEKFKGELYRAEVAGEQVLLLKPQTFMNLSGESVGPCAGFHKIAIEDVIVAHDEVDLPSMSLKLKSGGGTGGHNGLKSMNAGFGGKDGYHRVRIGVGKPPLLPSGRPGMDTADWVLGRYTSDELKQLDTLLDQAAEAVELMVRGKVLDAMNKFNRK